MMVRSLWDMLGDSLWDMLGDSLWDMLGGSLWIHCDSVWAGRVIIW